MKTMLETLLVIVGLAGVSGLITYTGLWLVRRDQEQHFAAAKRRILADRDARIRVIADAALAEIAAMRARHEKHTRTNNQEGTPR